MRSMFRMGFSGEHWFGLGQDAMAQMRQDLDDLHAACLAYGSAASTYRELASRNPDYEGQAREHERLRDDACRNYQAKLESYLEYEQRLKRSGLGQEFVPPSNLIQRGDLVGPTHIALTRSQIENGNGSLLKTLPVPKGWTATFPYVVKVNSSGEYMVYADGTAQYTDYKTGRVFAPERIK